MLLATDEPEVVEIAELREKWRWEAAWQARQFIISRNRYWKNRYRWPRTMREWRRVARKLGLDLVNIREGQANMRGRMLGDAIPLKACSPALMGYFAAHEVVEAVLRMECGLPPLCYPWEPGVDEMHEVARRAELWPEYPKLAG